MDGLQDDFLGFMTLMRVVSATHYHERPNSVRDRS